MIFNAAELNMNIAVHINWTLERFETNQLYLSIFLSIRQHSKTIIYSNIII